MAAKKKKTVSGKKKATKKKAAKKTTKKKTTKKKAAKKATTKKTARKKTAKKAAKKKATKKKTTKKAAKKKATEKKTTKKTAKKKAAKSKGTKTGVTVRIGPSKPTLAVAPGARIAATKKKSQKNKNPDAADNERKLTKRELNNIRDLLKIKRRQLLSSMKRELAMQRASHSSKAADEADKASDAYNEDLSFEITAANDQEVDKIEDALEKIENGTYGECEVCSCHISSSRLKILPFATHCAACRTEKELRSRGKNQSLAFGFIGSEEGLDED